MDNLYPEYADYASPMRAEIWLEKKRVVSDGLMDGEELELGTDPVESDTDGDGVSDGEELELGTDPTDEGSRPEIVVEDELHRGLPVWMMYLINTLESTRSSEKVGEQLKP